MEAVDEEFQQLLALAKLHGLKRVKGRNADHLFSPDLRCIFIPKRWIHVGFVANDRANVSDSLAYSSELHNSLIHWKTTGYKLP